MPAFYEFFAGGGMARLGLGPEWTCLFANDICEKKAASYRENFNGAPEMQTGDVWSLNAADLPGRADLAWASFPCQDLSLAGARGGLHARRSGAFWGFWRLMRELDAEGRAPHTLALENVVGLLTSRRGKDFETLLAVLSEKGYRVGALVLDGAWFTPQSRPRLFIVATRAAAPEGAPAACWLHPSLLRAFDRLPPSLRENWFWPPLPAPPPRAVGLENIIERDPADALWRSPEETRRLLGQMSPSNAFKLEQARKLARERDATIHGMGYRRTRTERGVKRQRLEVRFDGVAGCLRTPAGGSSRQFVVQVSPEGERVRLLSPREAARLMGLPDDYRLPDRYNEAYHLCGDGVVVGAVRWLSAHVLTPIARNQNARPNHEERIRAGHHSLLAIR